MPQIISFYAEIYYYPNFVQRTLLGYHFTDTFVIIAKLQILCIKLWNIIEIHFDLEFDLKLQRHAVFKTYNFSALLMKKFFLLLIHDVALEYLNSVKKHLNSRGSLVTKEKLQRHKYLGTDISFTTRMTSKFELLLFSWISIATAALNMCKYQTG